MFINETGNVIVKCADTVNAVKIRNIFYHILPIVFIAFILLIVILIKNPQLKLLRVTILDVLSIVMFIVLMLFLRKEVMMRNDIRNAFHGNNEYFGFYTNVQKKQENIVKWRKFIVYRQGKKYLYIIK